MVRVWPDENAGVKRDAETEDTHAERKGYKVTARARSCAAGVKAHMLEKRAAKRKRSLRDAPVA
jgi:hypothetical protein